MSVLSFLHQSYEYETIVAPCGFTDITAAQSPSFSGRTFVETFDTSPCTNRQRQYIYWVDKRRGLLGRTLVSCPLPEDLAAGRRSSKKIITIEQKLGVARRSSLARSSGQLSLSGANCYHQRSSDALQSRSLSMSAPLLVDTKNQGSMEETRQNCSKFTQGCCQGKTKEQDGILAASTENFKLPHDDNNSFFSSGDLNCSVSTRKKSHAVVGGYSPKRKEWSSKDSRYEGTGETVLDCASPDRAGKEVARDVQVLLRGLNSPTRIVALSGKTNKMHGVLFVNFATVSSQDSRGCEGKSPTTVNGKRANKLSFLAFEAQNYVTVVERLCNPIAICVAPDGDVLVLEDVGQLEAKSANEYQDIDQGKGSCRSCRYRVRYLHHVELNAFLESQRAQGNNSPTEDDSQGNKCTSRQHVECVSDADTQSETDWEETLSTSNSDEVYRTTTTNAKLENGLGRCRGTLKTMDPKHAFDLDLPPKGGPVEQPVDMCVLADSTIVMAFCRLAPLHEGEAVAESQGIVRAFPPSQITQGRRHRPAGSGSSSVVVDATKSEKFTSSSHVDTAGRHDCRHSSSYDPGEQWMVAEGLPVITRIAASGGEGGDVFVSFCGSGHDGAVIAIGSLSTRRTASATRMRTGALVKEIARVRQQKPLMSTEVRPRQLSKDNVRENRADVFLPIVSGYAAALAVDGSNNLFYITAQSRGTCEALWCRRAGASHRRRSSLFSTAPVLRVKNETGALLAISTSLCKNEKVKSNISREKHAVQIQAEAAVESGTLRAVALSAALLDEEEIASPAAGRWRNVGKPLFAANPTPGDQMSAWAAARGPGSRRGAALNGDSWVEESANVNIAVVARCRPLLEREIKRGVRRGVFCRGDVVVVSGKELPIKRSREFRFDRVFGPNTSQARVYTETVAPIVRKMLDGYNCSVLAYGQTGSGKTFTMEGGLDTSDHPNSAATTEKSRKRVETLGIISRAVHTIFREGDACGSRQFWVYVSHMEIYNEKLFDLLAPDADLTTTNVQRQYQPTERSPRKESSPNRPRTQSPARSPSPRPVAKSPSHVENISSPSPSRESFFRQQLFSPRRENSKTNRYGGEKSESSAALRSPKRTSDASPTNRGRGEYPGKSMGRSLTIEEHPKLGVTVKGLTQVEVKSPQEIFAIVAKSKSNRRTAETMCNVESSRSHGVFSVRVISAEATPWGGEITRDGRLSLVDLSGSENIKRSGAMGARAKEAAAIGQSLLALGRVVKALVQQARHVPYRESKLTRILGDSLGGNAFTAIILNITPNHGMVDETLSTLAYAKLAQAVQNTPKQHIAKFSKTSSDTSGKSDTIDSDTSTNLLEGDVGAQKQKKLITARSADVPYVCPWEGKVPIVTAPSTSWPLHVKGCLPLASLTKPLDSLEIPSGFRGLISGPMLQGGKDSGVASVWSHSSVAAKGQRPAAVGGIRKTHTDFAKHSKSCEPQVPGGVGEMHHFRISEPVCSDGPAEQENSRLAKTSVSVNNSRKLSSASGKVLVGQGVYRSSGGRQPPAVCDKNVAYNYSLGTAMGECWLLARKGRSSGNPLRGSGEEGQRVFDSSTSKWVHATVLMGHEEANKSNKTKQNRDNRTRTPRLRSKEHCNYGTNESTAQEEETGKSRLAVWSAARSGPRLELRPAAEAALMEIFDRYAQKERGFLMPDEAAVLLDVWREPAASPRSSHQRGPRPAGQLRYIRRNGVVNGRDFDYESNKNSDNGMVLPQKAFLQFCEEAAARDAIFIKHLFRCCGYDSHLNLSQAACHGQPSPQSKLNRRRDDVDLNKPDSGKYLADSYQGSRCNKKNQTGRPGTVVTSGPWPQEGHGIFVDGQDGELDGCYMTTGGIVQPVELWNWMEIRDNDGDRYRRDGVLSRGGGAHFSGPVPKQTHAVSHHMHNDHNPGGPSENISRALLKGGGKEKIVHQIEEECVVHPEGERVVSSRSTSGIEELKISPIVSNRDPTEREADVPLGCNFPQGVCKWCGCQIPSPMSIHTPGFCDPELLI